MSGIIASAFANGYEMGRLAFGLLLLAGGVVLVIVGFSKGRRDRTAAAAPTIGNSGMQWAPSESVDFFATAPAGARGLAGASAAPSSHWSQTVAPTWSPPPTSHRATPSSSSSMMPVVMILLGCLTMAFGAIRTAPIVLDIADHNTVSLPTSAGPYKKIEPPAGVQSSMDSLMAGMSHDSVVSGLEMGAYRRGTAGRASALLIVGEIAGNPNGEEFWKGLQSGVTGAGGTATLTPTTTAGMAGEMRCGTLTSTNASVPTCIWVDSDTLGIIMAVPGSTTSVVKTSNTLRAAAEH